MRKPIRARASSPERLRIRPAGATFDPAREAYASELFGARTAPSSADMFMNVANLRAVNFLGRHGARAVTLFGGNDAVNGSRRSPTVISPDAARKPALEIVAYGYQDLMISKYCPIAKTFEAKVALHALRAQSIQIERPHGLRASRSSTTATATSACSIRARSISSISSNSFKTSGVLRRRLDFTIEDADETKGVIAAYQKAILKQAYVVDRRKLDTTGRFVK
ncbi:MAG: hypothetical protein MZU95_08230 [Desulfomicrobium escambiense]|nr:hypothetical protein [Desulfomicrobium escambiense]